MTDENPKKNLFDDSDGDGGDEYVPPASDQTQENTAAVSEPAASENKPPLFDDGDDEYVPQAQEPAAQE